MHTLIVQCIHVTYSPLIIGHIADRTWKVDRKAVNTEHAKGNKLMHYMQTPANGSLASNARAGRT